MLVNKAKSSDLAAASIASGGGVMGKALAGGVFTVKCHDKDGNVKWETSTPNLVVNEGLQQMNTLFFAGSSYTATWYLGLYGSTSLNTPSATDTMTSHPGWTEETAYSQSTRPICSFGSATTADPSVISNSMSAATFSVNGPMVVGGAFLTSENTKGGTGGVLFSAANFSAPGDRSVISGDTLTVTYTFSLDAA